MNDRWDGRRTGSIAITPVDDRMNMLDKFADDALMSCHGVAPLSRFATCDHKHHSERKDTSGNADMTLQMAKAMAKIALQVKRHFETPRRLECSNS